MKYIAGMLILIFSLVGLDMITNSQPKYEVGDCAKSLLFPYIRKIQSVETYVYNYCTLVDNDTCGKETYSMRINDFDRIMAPIECNGDRK